MYAHTGLSVSGLAYEALVFFFSSRRRHTRLQGDWSSDVCSSDLRRRQRDRQRLHRRRRRGTGATRPESRFRVSIARARHRLGIRGRGADSVQEHPVSTAAAAGLAAEHRARGQALRLRGLLVPGAPRQRDVRRAIGQPGRPERYASWSGHGLESGGDRESERCSHPRRLSVRPRRPTAGWQRPLGVSDNLTLNGTFKPDFSQVESDAGQLGFDPRQALFFPEKRPFFLEGSELFQVPQNLIYTRRIVQPVAAVKLTGTTFGTDIGLLSAVDQKFASATGTENPIFTILRAQRSLGRGSRVGLVYTDRIEGGDYNRVAEVDSRLVFKEIYGLNLQLAGSRTRVGGVTTTAPLWLSQFTVQHRSWGLRSLFAGIADDFRVASGFIGRAGIVHSYVDPSYTTYGRPGALLQRFTGDIVLDGIWQYQNFIHGRHLQDKKLHFNGNAALRGGWNVGAGYFVESFGYDSALYADKRLEVPHAGGVDTVPFTGQPTIVNGEYIVQIRTPQWKHFSGSGYFLQGHDENFFEWASADLRLLSVDLSYRPTERLRNSLSYYWQQVNRRTDGSLVNVGRVLRAKLEYQLSRPLFIRVVGQYIKDKTDSLRDDSRTGAPIFIVGPDSSLTRAAASHSNRFHADLLLSYQPVPGTVVFAGYGSNMMDEDAFEFRRLTRTDDTFFLKLSYLFRL